MLIQVLTIILIYLVIFALVDLIYGECEILKEIFQLIFTGLSSLFISINKIVYYFNIDKPRDENKEIISFHDTYKPLPILESNVGAYTTQDVMQNNNEDTNNNLSNLDNSEYEIVIDDFWQKESADIEVVVSDYTIEEPQVFKFIEPEIIELEEIEKRINSNSNTNKNARISKQTPNALKLKKIGDLGELYIYAYEKNYLTKLNRPDLAQKVKHVSAEFDGYGYDIISFDKNGNEILIEVKTTVSNAKTDFFITDNELHIMNTTNNYYIYRLFNFDSELCVGDLIKINCNTDFKQRFNLIENTYEIKKRQLS